MLQKILKNLVTFGPVPGMNKLRPYEDAGTMFFMKESMGKVTAEFQLWNFMDEAAVMGGFKAPLVEECLVDTGATLPVIPERVALALGLSREPERVKVGFANGVWELREVAVGLRLKFLDRRTNCRAVIEPGRDNVLIGQIVLEDMDVLVDCKSQKLVPRDPSGAVTEVLAETC